MRYVRNEITMQVRGISVGITGNLGWKCKNCEESYWRLRWKLKYSGRKDIQYQ